MTKYLVIVEQSEAGYGAYVPDLSGCVAVGETQDEVRELIHEAITFHIEGLREEGLPVPASLSRSEYVELEAA
jgi:predicted RNase H-like HicB family nuclease